jgi:hypothetical protein
MRIIFLKELREDGLWAFLGMLIFSGLLVMVVHDGGQSIGPLRLVLVNARMAMVTGFMLPAMGFALGMLAVLQDRSAGRWGFLIHRPISPSSIFFAKFLAGLLNYLAASVVPLAVTTLWVATPGNVAAPFDWHMILPRLADVLGGIGWFSAGMLVGARQARWIGSRLFPVGLALVASFYVDLLATQPLPAFFVHLAVVGLLAPAACGAFGAGGEYESQNWIFKLLQTISVGVGLGMAIIAGTGLVIGGIELIVGRQPYSYSYYVLDNSGRTIRATMRSDGPPTYGDLSGSELAAQDLKFDDVHILNFYEGRGIAPAFESRFNEPSSYGQWTGSYGQWGNSDGNVIWYYVPYRRTLEGFEDDDLHPNNGHFVGSLGPSGFRPEAEPAEPFPGGLHVQDFHYPAIGLVFNDRTIWRLNTSDPPSLTQLYAAKVDDPITNVSDEFFNPTDKSAVAPWWFPMVATRSALIFFKNSQESVRLPLERNFSSGFDVTVAHSEDGRYFTLYRPLLRDNQTPSLLVETNGTGQVLNRIVLPPLQSHDLGMPRVDDAIARLVAPPGVGLGIEMYRFYDRSWRMAWLKVLEFMTVGIAAATITRLLMRRYDGSRANIWLWTIVGGLLGIGGVLLLICVRQVVARVGCPHCGRRRRVTGERCEYCDAEWTAPARNGTEVFEPAL